MEENEIVPTPEEVEEVSADTASVELAGEEQQPEEKAPKTFTQEELEAEIGKRLARERRKFERQMAQQQQPAAQAKQAGKSLDPAEFPSLDAYAEALAEQKIAAKEAARQQATVEETYDEREFEARGRYTDYDQVARNPNLNVSEIMAQAIMAAENGPDILYHLGNNPKEAARIANLSAMLQVKEIGRLEARLSDAPAPVKKTTAAPAPIQPVTPKAGTPVYDTTDPRSIKTMTTSEWINAERERQRRQWAAQNR